VASSKDPREEFFVEAQEIVDLLARDLLFLDEAIRRGAEDPEALNDLFRGVHTLKGLSGLFGMERMSALTHTFETKLDELRLGKIPLTAQVLDRLFRAVELVGRLLAAARATGRDDDPELAKFVAELEGTEVRAPEAGPSLGDYDLDPGLVSVLTEYEEHRLRHNIQIGTPLYRLRAKFPLLTIDKGLDELKSKAKPLGEIITYLPSGSTSDDDSLELDILYASVAPLEQLRARIEIPGVTAQLVERRSAIPDDGAHASSAGSPSLSTPDGQGLDPRIPGPPAIPAETSARARDPSDPAPVPERGASVPEVPRRHTPVAPRAEVAVEADPGARGIGGRASHSVRVDIRRLDHLMNVLGELAIVRSALQRVTERVREMPAMRDTSTELHRLHRSFERNLSEMQSGILEVRMVPLGQVFERLARAVRQISRANNKDIRFVITGADTEVDKLIVEELSDPLLHIVRNSIDHGIETQADRSKAGKPGEGTIALNAYQAGNHVVIEIEDDGAGIDEGKVLAAAVRRGIVREDEARDLSRREATNLIFLPGFSTREMVTDLSGRGVGLDVVKTNIGRLGGVVDVTSDLGIGTKFTLTLPITLAILRALLLGVAGRSYAIPLASVAEATVLDPTRVRTIEGREVTTLRGATLTLCRLDRLFQHARTAPAPARSFIVVVALGGRRIGVVVDELFGQQDIVIKALGPSLAGVRGIAGATDLGDQRVGLVLDAGAILEEVLAGASEWRMTEAHSGGRFPA